MIVQKEEHFWRCIKERFHIVMGRGEYRTKDQFTSKFHEMNKMITKFNETLINLICQRKKR